MIGGAAERIVLGLRDVTVQKLKSLSLTSPRGMSDWKVKTVSDSLHHFLSGHKARFPRPLRENFEAYWPAFIQQIRATRNDVGHPMSIDPVTYDAVHASLLVFPEFAKPANNLDLWVTNDLT